MIRKLALAFALLFSVLLHSQIVINELDADTPSTDNLEFIELKSTTPNFSLNGYVLVFLMVEALEPQTLVIKLLIWMVM